MKPYRIIGQGLAGTILSMEMENRGIPHRIIDEPQLSASSRVAAGLVNPVVLKRLRLVYEANLFYQALPGFYRKWEQKLDTSFLHSASIQHIFQSQGEQNAWLEKSENPAFQPFLGEVIRNNDPSIQAPYGLGQTQNTYWLDTSTLLDEYRSYLMAKDRYENGKVHTHQANEHDIWCTGHLFRQTGLPENIFTPTRGELLLIRAEELKFQNIIHAGVFILPVGNDLFKVGSTYAWDNLSDTPTDKGRKSLESELKKIFRGNYTVVEHWAGVRPNIRDRKPIIGKWQQSYIFNGLGSRGTMLGPRLAGIFLDFLTEQKPIPSEYDISRFI